MAEENTAFIFELTGLIKRHYPDGRMRADDIYTYFGMVLAGALADQPEAVRDRAARHIAQQIRVPDRKLKRLF